MEGKSGQVGRMRRVLLAGKHQPGVQGGERGGGEGEREREQEPERTHGELSRLPYPPDQTQRRAYRGRGERERGDSPDLPYSTVSVITCAPRLATE